VTGSTDGIGKAFAMELASRGFNIVLISRNIDKLNATAKEVQAKGKASGFNDIQTRVLVFDFCDDTSLEAYNELYKKISNLDISVLVNNVGIALPTERSPQQVYREIAANCYPVVLLT
jgi:17beta-estradiol 17-dehydrogenase / very-long-chain 3-oxoacyl-CoA reductase